ncbi:hypothetical protein ACQBAU_16140 [Propionibacteriaceae bacterium Y2011]
MTWSLRRQLEELHDDVPSREELARDAELDRRYPPKLSAETRARIRTVVGEDPWARHGGDCS